MSLRGFRSDRSRPIRVNLTAPKVYNASPAQSQFCVVCKIGAGLEMARSLDTRHYIYPALRSNKKRSILGWAGETFSSCGALFVAKNATLIIFMDGLVKHSASSKFILA
jgi:hypothetical protein